jgi:uncharacterized membrane protein
MNEFFSEYRTVIVFIHVISAVVWVGGMIIMRFAVHYSFAHLEGAEKLQRTSHALKNLFMLVLPFIVTLLISALVMATAMGLHFSDMSMFTIVKELIWLFMAINFALMAWRRLQAQKSINIGEFAKARASLEPIGKYMVPLNIILGLVAIYLGVMLSHHF